MKAEIKDKDGEILTGIRAAGYKVDKIVIETFLNISDFIRDNKKATSLKDIIEIQELVRSLFED